VHVQRGVLAAEQRNVNGARAAFDRALAIDQASLAALAGHVGLDLMARNATAARTRVDARLNAGTPSGELLLIAARTYAATNDIAGAEQLLKRAINEQPSLLPAYASLAQIYLSQRRLSEARKEFDTLADRQTRPVAALTMAGMIAQAEGDDAGARARLERAVSIESRAAVASNNLAWLLAEEGTNLDRALQLAQAATTAAPDAPEMLDTLGWVYYKKKSPDLAVPAFNSAVEKSPNNPLYHYHLGLAHLQAGDQAKGRRALERALALKNDFPGADDARRALATLGTQQGR
jgi:Tfp pilus assembly protein PilF